MPWERTLLCGLTLLCASLLALGRGDPEVSYAISAYKPLRRHPELFDSKVGWGEWLDPALKAGLEDYRLTGNSTLIFAHLREETRDVYSFSLFSEAFCDMFLDELDGYRASGLPISRPNSMNNYGIIVNHIGLRPAITRFQKDVLQPLSELLFPVQVQGGFDSHHSFMVQYKADEDLGLDMHTDDSDVTFNMCLGRSFTGASLTICGDSRTPQHRHFHHSYEHVRGRALVHLGSRRHGADDIRAGERNNLIVWNSNTRYRASSEYVNKQPYLREEGEPDPRCLSYTHDRDFGAFLDYPPGKESFQGRGWCPPAFACYDSMHPVLKGQRDEL